LNTAHRLVFALVGFLGLCSATPFAQNSSGLLRSPLPACSAASSETWHDCQSAVTLSGGQRYIGEFRAGRRHGLGEMRSASGARYVGEFREGQPEGLGSYIFQSGARYVGYFKAGRRDGEGIFYSADGALRASGRWAGDAIGERYAVAPSAYPFDSADVLIAARAREVDLLLAAQANERARQDQQARQALAQAQANEAAERQRLAAARQRMQDEARLAASIQTARASLSNTKISERRVALVVGNSAYRAKPLENPVNDASDIAASLQKLGFNVSLVLDATLARMRQATREFEKVAAGSDVALIFYAGHGVEYRNANYMIPVDADPRRPYELEDTAYNANRWLQMLELTSSQNAQRVNIVILDACRDSAFTRSWNSRSVGLAKMDAPTGTILVYSTAPGKVAADGIAGQRNSPFTRNLLNAIQVPNQTIEQVLKETRRRVMDETRGEQVPWEHSSLVGDFVFLRER
jgi:hypothetical protein